MIETVEYAMESVYDDTTTDYLYTRHSFVGRALVNGQEAVVKGVPDRILGGIFRNGPPISYGPGDSIAGPVGGPVPGVRPPGAGPDDVADPVSSFPPGYPMTPVQTGNAVGNLGAIPPGQGLTADNSNQLFTIVSKPVDPTSSVYTVRHRLTTPRGRLYIFSGGWDDAAPAPLLLSSPIDGARCDCKNGPIPRVFSIVRAHGDATTLEVDFAIDTYVNESGINGTANPGPLLSNRFSQHQIIDERSYTAIETQGTALFRTDQLYMLPQSPDQIRSLLFMPIPQGFFREGIEVVGLPDATGVQYSFVDHQQPINFVAGSYIRAAKISAIHRQAAVQSTDILEGAMTTYERVLGIQANRNIARDDRSQKARARRRVLPPNTQAKNTAIGGTPPVP